MSAVVAEPDLKIHNADEQPDAKEPSHEEVAADQLAKRILDLAPDCGVTAETVLEWGEDDDQSKEVREAVTALLNDPPKKLGEWPEIVTEVLTFSVAAELYVATIQRKLANAMARDRLVRDSERRLGKEKRALKRIEDEIKSLNNEKKTQQDVVDAAVASLQSRVRDQASGQNALKFEEPTGDVSAAATSDAPAVSAAPADPAASAPIADLGLSSALTEKMVEAGLNRVADAIEWLNTDTPAKKKGLGASKITEIGNALNRWREAHPVE